MMKKRENYQQEQAKKKDLSALAKRLRSIRKSLGYTNYENFAYEHGIPRAQYGRYENGQDIRYTTLMRIIRAFGMTPEEFFSEGFGDDKV